MDADKRKHKRYIFPNDETMTAQVCLSGDKNFIEARLLNVSEGGIGLAVAKEQTQDISVTSELLMVNFHEMSQLQGLRDVLLKVRWVLDYTPLDHLGLGCEFVNLPENGKKEILELVKRLGL